MYSERIRKSEAYYGTLLYQRRKGIAEGIEQGIEQGRAEGIEQGKRAFAALVQEGLLTKEQASEKLGIPISEFEKYL